MGKSTRKMDSLKSILFYYEYSKFEIKTLFLLKSSYFLKTLSEFLDNMKYP